MPTTRTRKILLTVTVVVTAGAMAVSCSSSRPIRWKTDDLLLDNGRYYTTCEDPANEDHEREVWLTDEQAAEHAEGADCPDGPIRTFDYWQQPDQDRKRTTLIVLPPPRKPTVNAPAGTVGKPTAPATPASSATPAATPSGKPATPTGQPTNTIKPKSTPTAKTGS